MRAAKVSEAGWKRAAEWASDLPESGVIGRLICVIGDDSRVAQGYHGDDPQLELQPCWREQSPGNLQCTIFESAESENAVVQLDLHGDGTVRVEAHEPCSVTVDPATGLVRISFYFH